MTTLYVMHEQQPILSPDLAHRLAAIDIGTNSVRLVVAEALREGNYRILDEEKETVRLGRVLSSTGRLDPDAVTRAVAALRRMKQIAMGFQVRELRVIATCAVREAVDGPDFCRRVQAENDLDVETISAETEAHLAFISVARSFNLEGKNVLVTDIGGGSTELVLASGRVIESVRSAPLGAVRLTEMFGSAAADDPEAYDRLVQWIDDELRRHARKLPAAPHLLIGSGGTFTTLGEMVMAAKGQSGLPLRGYEVTHAELRHTLDRLRKMPLKLRRGVPGLSPDRADIIVAGLAIVDGVVRRFDLNRLLVHDRGVRDGLLLTMIDRAVGPPAPGAQDRDAELDRFAMACGVDVKHDRHVARLAGMIFTQLAPRFHLDPADLPLLEAAARLQDVGYLINYEQHHKHSYHLILNSRLTGWQPHELELIANIARYHRGAKPKKKHANFRRLPPRDRRRVRALASILRLAGGLDRSNTQQVEAVSIEVDGSKIHLRAVASQLPEVDLWGAQRRARAFEKAFGRRLAIEWHGALSSAAADQALADSA